MKTWLLFVFITITIDCMAPVNSLQKQQQEQEINSILLTIRMLESHNQYNAKGGSGEYGAYQFTPATWRMECKKRFKKVLSIKDTINQDDVAKAIIIDLINKGYSKEQIASHWNCGSKNFKGKIGVNKYGVSYNVPKYVKEFVKIYKSMLT